MTLHEGNSPITGLAFRQVAKVTHLFVSTLEKVYVSVPALSCMKMNLLNSRSISIKSLRFLSPFYQCYTLSVKEYPKVELDRHGCALRCSCLADPSQDSQFIVAGDECVYLYQPDERGPCFAFDGHKLLAHWHRGYLFLLIRDPKSPNK